METATEQLRKLVIEGKESIPNRGVRTFTLLQELTFIENYYCPLNFRVQQKN